VAIGPAERARGSEPGGGADHVVGTRAAHGTGQPAQAEAGIRHDDDRADAHAGVEHGGEVGARRHEQGDPVARFHADTHEAGRDLPHPARQQPPGHDARAGRPAAGIHVHERGLVAALQPVEVVPERSVGDHGRLPSGFNGCRGPDRRHTPGTSIDIRHPTPAEPAERHRGVRGILHHEVPGALETVHVGVRHPLDQVVEVAITEDRVARPPDQQRGHGQSAQSLGDAVEFRPALVRGVHRNVGDEGADTAAASGAAVGRAVGGFHVRREGGMRQR
jgi:hypothetical protein